MDSGCSGKPAEPLGKGSSAPVDSLTVWLLATAMAGVPAPLSETAPIQVNGLPAPELRPAIAPARKLIAVSAGGGAKVGEGSSRNRVKGVASFPAVGCIRLRLWR